MRLLSIALVALLVCAPWLAYTYHLTGKPVYWGDSSGLSLYWMSPTRGDETGQWHSPREVENDPALRAFRPLFTQLATLHPLDRDLELKRIASENIRGDPTTYARNLAANASRLFFLVPMKPTRPWLVIAGCAVFNGALLVAVAAAVSRLWRRRRSRPPELVPVALLAAFAVAVHLPLSAQPRMLLPVVPLLLFVLGLSLARSPKLSDATP